MSKQCICSDNTVLLNKAVAIYEGGLPERQLLLVLEYINEHLNRDIKLADLAQLLDMSQFHFSHMFKQAIGIAPYQYPIQQRVERAKQLLKLSRSIDYGHCCIGVGSTATVIRSTQFRLFTGMTPTAGAIELSDRGVRPSLVLQV